MIKMIKMIKMITIIKINKIIKEETKYKETKIKETKIEKETKICLVGWLFGSNAGYNRLISF